jgi:glycosyltransferase involved in cell wall biosynthesis
MSRPDEINLSVIIPTKNRPQLLKRAIASVAQQSYTRFEVCVVDNNINPEVSNAVKETVDSFRQQYPNISWIYTHSAKPFASGARNDGMAATSGKYIIFLDDDDEFLVDSIKIRMDEMTADPELALLYCAAYSKIYPYPFKMYRYYHYNKRLHKDKLMMMSCSSIMINRDIFEHNNLWFDEFQSRMDDYDLCRKIIELDLKVKSIPNPLVMIYLHPDTRISSHGLVSYDFKDALISRWGDTVIDVVYSYAEGVYLWRKCFGISDYRHTEVVKQLEKDFNRKPGLSFKFKYMLLSVSPKFYLGLYHLSVSLSQYKKNNQARVG